MNGVTAAQGIEMQNDEDGLLGGGAAIIDGLGSCWVLVEFLFY